MFACESFLHELYKLAHGTRNIGAQIAHWYAIDRAVQSISAQRHGNQSFHGKLLNNYLDQRVVGRFREQFDQVFNRQFHISSVNLVALRSRYKSGPIMYHSLSYSLCKQSTSYNVCVCNSQCPKNICFGKIVFFFMYKSEPFFCLLLHQCSMTCSFSDAIQIDEHIQGWSERINTFYSVVNENASDLVIFPCSALLSKCFFFPCRDKRFFYCTSIDNELEHD